MSERLPVGSVVRVKGITVRNFMVMGYDFTDEGKTYDYLGVVYPVGMTDERSCFVFNHTSVEEVLFEGFRETEEVEANG